MQAASLTMHCNALHAADGTIPLLLGVMGVHSAFFVPGDLTFDLDIQTRPNERPNTSSL